MNDRAVAVLENYDIEVGNTGKGRGYIWCNTNKGMLVLKEYKGDTNKLAMIDRMQEKVSDIVNTDRLVKTKEDEFFCKDADQTTYILKQQLEGKECNYKSEEDVVFAFKTMARLHREMRSPDDNELLNLPFYSFVDEMEKHTRECKRVWNYLIKLKKRTEFEKALLRNYSYFMDKSFEILSKAKEIDMDNYRNEVENKGYFYHGDYQYHNILFDKNDIGVINFERMGKDSGVKDLYFLYRKIAEKTQWNVALCEKMLSSYISRRTLSANEIKLLALKLEYPEKFWKIVNFYYNSKKSWIPDKNLEKLEILVSQEKYKSNSINTLFR